jgi:hypothetical protein
MTVGVATEKVVREWRIWRPFDGGRRQTELLENQAIKLATHPAV